MGEKYTLNIQNIQLWANHGNYTEEQTLGQKFLADIEVAYDMRQMCLSDDVEKGLSYLTVYAIAKQIILDERHKLIQRIAYRIAEELFKAYPALERAKVTIKKPFVPIKGIVDYVSVTVELQNDALGDPMV